MEDELKYNIKLDIGDFIIFCNNENLKMIKSNLSPIEIRRAYNKGCDILKLDVERKAKLLHTKHFLHKKTLQKYIDAGLSEWAESIAGIDAISLTSIFLFTVYKGNPLFKFSKSNLIVENVYICKSRYWD